MAVTSITMALPVTAPAKLERTSFAGSRVEGLPSLGAISKERTTFRVEASRNRKINTKEPFGPSGGLKLAKGVDAGGRKPKGKGVYQFSKKYGANVDGYSPIYDTGEWTSSGDIYAGGQSGLALWAALLGGLLISGALLVYNTSALAP